MEIVMKLSDWLDKQGISIRDLGKQTKISSSQIWRIANGESWPSRDAAVTLIEATNAEVTADDLFNIPKRMRKVA
jgi:hypothetical protein